MSDWQPIETAPENCSRMLLWCADLNLSEPIGCRFGRTVDGDIYGDGMNGDWLFSHWMPIPGPPEPVCDECGGEGVIGYAPDQYQDCPTCRERAASDAPEAVHLNKNRSFHSRGMA